MKLNDNSEFCDFDLVMSRSTNPFLESLEAFAFRRHKMLQLCSLKTLLSSAMFMHNSNKLFIKLVFTRWWKQEKRKRNGGKLPTLRARETKQHIVLHNWEENIFALWKPLWIQFKSNLKAVKLDENNGKQFISSSSFFD